MKNIIVLLAFLVPAVSFAVSEPVACTMDVKLCPDGVTYVGRTGPSCEFAACPGETKPPICTSFVFDLDVGATDTTTNGQVSVLQNFLYPQYLKTKPTGAFYSQTRAAVAQFQKDHGIFPSRGYVGSLTRAKLQELLCGVTQGVQITTVDSKKVKIGESLTLGGVGLNTGGDYILFNGYRIETDGSKVANRVSFKIPETISKTVYCITTPCPQPNPIEVTPGRYSVQVVNNTGSSNIVTITVVKGAALPTDEKISISFVEPTSAKVGASVVIYGYNLFRPETRILFDGTSIKGTPVYNKRLGNFNSALEFTVPSYLSSCTGFFCLASLGKKVTPGTYELAVDNKYGRDSIKFEVIGDVANGKPYLTYSNPSQAPVGTEIFVFGENLNTGSEKVYFGGSQVLPLTSASTDRKGMVRFKIPEYITPCGYEDNVVCRMMAQLVTPGKYDIVVKNKDGISNALSFTVVGGVINPKPQITSISPATGIIGTEVTISGQGINIGTDQIYFGGSLVEPKLSSSADVANTLRFRIPEYITPCGVGGQNVCKIASMMVAPGKYDVVVVNKNGTSNSLSFEVMAPPISQKPTLQTISPASAKVGEVVRVAGTNINIGDDKIYFSGTVVSRADFIELPNSISFVVPSTYQPCPVGTDCKIANQDVVPGTYPITVINKYGQSNSLELTIAK